MLTRRAAIAAIPCVASLMAGEQMLVRDLKGSSVTIPTGKDVTVVMFISTQCPISNDYNDRMSAVYEDYSAKGVQFFFVNANLTEPANVVDEHRKSSGFPFAVYKDENVAEKLNASVTPEVFVFDKAGKRVYHGYIDDARNAARITKQGLRDALDATLAGKPVANAETKAFGCTIKRARKSS